MAMPMGERTNALWASNSGVALNCFDIGDSESGLRGL
jgi:hypothetical protein